MNDHTHHDSAPRREPIQPAQPPVTPSSDDGSPSGEPAHITVDVAPTADRTVICDRHAKYGFRGHRTPLYVGYSISAQPTGGPNDRTLTPSTFERSPISRRAIALAVRTGPDDRGATLDWIDGTPFTPAMPATMRGLRPVVEKERPTTHD